MYLILQFGKNFTAYIRDLIYLYIDSTKDVEEGKIYVYQKT